MAPFATRCQILHAMFLLDMAGYRKCEKIICGIIMALFCQISNFVWNFHCFLLNEKIERIKKNVQRIFYKICLGITQKSELTFSEKERAMQSQNICHLEKNIFTLIFFSFKDCCQWVRFRLSEVETILRSSCVFHTLCATKWLCDVHTLSSIHAAVIKYLFICAWTHLLLGREQKNNVSATTTSAAVVLIMMPGWKNEPQRRQTHTHMHLPLYVMLHESFRFQAPL